MGAVDIANPQIYSIRFDSFLKLGNCEKYSKNPRNNAGNPVNGREDHRDGPGYHRKSRVGCTYTTRLFLQLQYIVDFNFGGIGIPLLCRGIHEIHM